MHAEIANGKLQIYPETPEESAELHRFHIDGLKPVAGALFQVRADGVDLPEKMLAMLQITRKEGET